MVKKDYVIGIDCSTTASKAIVWDKDGNCIAEGRSEIPLPAPKPEWAEQEAEKWWEATARAVRTAVQQVEKMRIGAIGITHQRETFVPLDKSMKPLRNGILWLDTRATSEVKKLKTLGAEKVHRKTGLYLNLYASNVKIMWIRENEPGLFESVYKFLDVFAFLAWKMTGRLVTSWPSADPMGLLNMETLCWDDEILKIVGVKEEQLCELAAPGEIVGTVTNEASAVLGLHEGVPVAGGGGVTGSARLLAPGSWKAGALHSTWEPRWFPSFIPKNM